MRKMNTSEYVYPKNSTQQDILVGRACLLADTRNRKKHFAPIPEPGEDITICRADGGDI